MFWNIKEELYFLKVWYKKIFTYPQDIIPIEINYDDYWEERGIGTKPALNAWQLERAHIIAGRLGQEKDIVIMDIGCGDGGVLEYLIKNTNIKKAIGVDISERVLDSAKKLDIEVLHGDFASNDFFKKLPNADYTFLLEVLEHLPISERVLNNAMGKSTRGVFFSVPNTGYFIFRLRLLFGKAPMQWRVHPGEHVRFWTMTDLKWWLGALGYSDFYIKGYQGVPVLNKLWPSLFSGGIIVYLKK